VPTLPEALRAFSAAVFDPNPGSRDPGIEVYRRNLRANFAKVLALEFPAVERLLGSERFAAVAADYQQSEPSRSGNLHGIGAGFAAHLAARLEPPALRWIADVAALEWAWEESAVAGDAAMRLEAAALAGMPAERLWALQLVPHPALRIVRSRYPIHTIWRANLPDAAGRIAALEPQFQLALDQGAESVLIERPGTEVEVSGIAAVEAAWLGALAGGASLGAALDAALALDAGFDLTAALAQVLSRRRMVAIVA
jgi:hypothetical protein